MKDRSDQHHRRSIRLQGYDYSQSGAYFVTIVARNRLCLFGEIVDGAMQLNDAGRMIATEWCALPTRFPTVQLDAFVVMPNHVHGIIVLTDGNTPGVGAPLVGAQRNNGDMSHVGAPLVGARNLGAAQSPALDDVVGGAYKSLTTVAFAQGVNTLGWPPFPGKLWQRNYYEHIIRNEDDLQRIRQYIADNPIRWAEDPENPVGTPLVGTQRNNSDMSGVGAPLMGAQRNRSNTPDVGAPLVGAQNQTARTFHVGAQSNPAHNNTRATTRVAPTRKS